MQELGFGIGLRPNHYADFHAGPKVKIDWLEVISENFMGIGGRPRWHLEKIRSDYPIATHGVGLDIAGSDPLQERYLHLLRDYIHWLQPCMVTDHLCWTRWQGKNSFDLLPFPLHEASLDHVVARVHHVQELLKRPLLLENPSCYIDFQASTLHEADFLNQLCKRTGCGILLDLNNCIVNGKNLGWDPHSYLTRLKPEYVQQFHLAGHSVAPDICIDTHDRNVDDDVWQLYRCAVQLFPGVPSLIEWDGKIPSLTELGDELDKARHHARLAQKAQDRSPSPHEAEQHTVSSRASSPWHQDQKQLFGLIRGEASPEQPYDLWLRPAPVAHIHGLSAYQNNHYLGLLEALKDMFPTLLAIIEDEAMTELVQRFIHFMPPEAYSINGAGEKLPLFIRDHPLKIDFGVPQALIADLARLDYTRQSLAIAPDAAGPSLQVEQLLAFTPDDWNAVRFNLRAEYKIFDSAWDILSVYIGLKQNELPPPPAAIASRILMTRQAYEVHLEACPAALNRLLTLGTIPFSLFDLAHEFSEANQNEEQITGAALAALLSAVQRGLIAIAIPH